MRGRKKKGQSAQRAHAGSKPYDLTHSNHAARRPAARWSLDGRQSAETRKPPSLAFRRFRHRGDSLASTHPREGMHRVDTGKSPRSPRTATFLKSRPTRRAKAGFHRPRALPALAPVPGVPNEQIRPSCNTREKKKEKKKKRKRKTEHKDELSSLLQVIR